MRIAANDTAKCRLRGSVGLVHMPAATSAGRVAGVNRFYLDALFAGHMPDLQKERGERPPVMNQALLFGHPDPVPNALEVFDRYRPRAGLQRLVHDPICHIPEQPFDRSLLFARQPFQKPSLIAALVPCGLKITALSESSLSNALDNSAVEDLAGVDSGNSDDAGIDADHAVALRVGNVFCDDQMQIPVSVFVGDCGSRLDLLRPVEIWPVVIGENQADSRPAVERGERGVFLIEFYCQGAGVVAHRRHPLPAVVFFRVPLVSFRHDTAGGANEIGRQLRHHTHVLIGDVVKGDRVEDFLLGIALRKASAQCRFPAAGYKPAVSIGETYDLSQFSTEEADRMGLGRTSGLLASRKPFPVHL
jgi:hypothetical protein